MIENHAAMKWERLVNECLKERDECLSLATKNRKIADRYREALEAIVKVNVNTKAEVGSYLQTIAREALKGV